MTTRAVGDVLREPGPDVRTGTRIGDYMRWLERTRGLEFDGYRALHRWSVDDLDSFWSSIWEFAGVRATTPPTAVLAEAAMPARSGSLGRGSTTLNTPPSRRQR